MTIASKPALSRSAFWSRLDVKSAPYLYIAPFFLLFALVGLFPLLYTAFVSVHKWGLITGNGGFVGLKNYSDVLGQPRFWQAMKTAAITCGTEDSTKMLNVLPIACQKRGWPSTSE